MKIPNEFKNFEEEFFHLNEKEKVASIELTYESPEDIFNQNVITRTPVMNDDFIDLVSKVFNIVPDEYKLDIRVVFDDLCGYDAKELKDICRKNIILEGKRQYGNARSQNLLALSFCAVGFFFIIISALLDRIWLQEGLLRNIAAFLLDTAATVPFWSAADIYFVENKERRRKNLNFIRRCDSITFYQKEKQAI